MRVIVLLLIVLALMLSGFSGCEIEKTPSVSVESTVGEHKFLVEIADDSAERARGLMNREELGKNEGMWFVFEEDQNLSFWMQNTLIPLDMIFVNSTFDIVDINRDALPCVQGEPCIIYHSKLPARYVLEINGGLSDEFEIKEGDKVKISI